jgi:hypothetical protein
MGTDPAPWLLLIHRLPAQKPTLRVKIWRRLQSVGAVVLQNSVYVLPNNDACREHLEWVVREIERNGGEASVCEARLLEGFGDDEIRAAFVEARELDYQALAEEAKKLLEASAPKRGRARSPSLAAAVQRLRRRKSEIESIDFFSAPAANALERAIARLERRANAPAGRTAALSGRRWSRAEVRGRTWVTRRGI